jgi:hypothetical protein
VVADRLTVWIPWSSALVSVFRNATYGLTLPIEHLLLQLVEWLYVRIGNPQLAHLFLRHEGLGASPVSAPETLSSATI